LALSSITGSMFPVVELNKMVTPGPFPANMPGLYSAMAKRPFPPL